MVEARVDIRKLQQFLMGQQVNPSKAMCSKLTGLPSVCLKLMFHSWKVTFIHFEDCFFIGGRYVL